MLKHLKFLFLFSAIIYAPHSIFSQDTMDQILEKGFERYENGDCDGAIIEYNKVLKQDSKNSEALYLRGVCKSLSEDNKSAIDDFTLAVKYNPTYAEAYFEMAYSYYILEEHNKALQFYNTAIDVDPDYAEAYMNRGSLKHNKNDMKGACEDWSKAESLGINLAYDLIKEFCMD